MTEPPPNEIRCRNESKVDDPVTAIEASEEERLESSQTKSTDLSRICVIIPALNEEQSLPLVLGDLPSVGQVLVVDNGSTDRTAELAAAAGARVVSEPRRGYGQACLAGIDSARQWIQSQRHEIDEVVAVFLDADYSDHPEQLIDLVDPVLKREVDFVLGSRLQGRREPGAMPPQSVFGNHFACWLMRLFWGAKFTDLGPFRAIRWSTLEQLAMVDQNYGWTIEMQIKAIRQRVRWTEIPADYRCRVGKSKISGTVLGSVKAGYKILFTIAKYGLTTWKPKRSQ